MANPNPALLAQTDDAPAFLTVRGNKEKLAGYPIAMVGARNASANGQYLAETLARDLGNAGMIVVSGLARGIDVAAHRGALATGTVAVIGGGIDIAYPRENRHLQDAIADTGLLVTEARPGEQPTARHFPRRNRIIAGMSAGVIVVEAAPRSGSLITARLAGEYGRDVFAVPGAAHDPRGRGTNQLLREGAILTETADDVLAALPRGFEPPRPTIFTPVPRPPVQTALPSAADLKDNDGDDDDPLSAITSALGTVPSRIDDIVRLTGIPSDAVLSAFTELELAGRLERHPGGRVALRAAR